MQTERTEIIRAYQLKPGNIFQFNGFITRVIKIEKNRIFYRIKNRHMESIGMFSQQRIVLLPDCDETIFNKQ